MNVLLMHHGGDQIRGTEACLFKTIEALSSDGCDIYLVRNNGVIDQSVRSLCTEIYYSSFPEIMLDEKIRIPFVRYIKEILRLYRLLRKRNIKSLYLSGGLPCQLGVPLAGLLKAKTVCHFHHPAPKRYLYLWLVFLVDQIITPSKYISKLVEKNLKKGNTPIYVGPNPNYYPLSRRPGDRNNWLTAIKNDSVVFIQTGNLAKHKRPALLIHAFSEAHKKNSNIILLLVGDGPMRSELESLIVSYGLSNSVFLLGFVESPAEYLQNVADVNCLVSVEEGLGISVLEASACRIPSIVADCTGLTETVIDGVTGIKVEPDSVESLCDAMLKLASEPELRAGYGEAAYKRVLTEFSIEEYKKSVRSIVLGNTRQNE